jgi:methylase of polypeptide subunit release factors
MAFMVKRKHFYRIKRKSANATLHEDTTEYHAGANGNHLRKPTKPRILDLFCCAGGVAVGYSRAGFEVVGVDIKPQPNFPFEFIKADALKLDMKFLKSFDAIHASPPLSGLFRSGQKKQKRPRVAAPD